MSGKIQSHKDLMLWQKAMDLVVEIYSLTKEFPKEESYGLTGQIRRAAVSIPSNIAEGSSRKSKKEFIQFLYIAAGSVSELETQMMIALRLSYIKNDDIIKKLSEIGKMLTGLIASLRKKEV